MLFFSRNKKLPVIFAASTLLLVLPGFNAKAEQPSVATVEELTIGDRACYVTVVDEDGQSSVEFAAFDICEQDIVGQQVRLTYESGEVIAASCGGDIDCGQTETVQLITQAEILAAATTPSITVQNLPDGNYRYWSGTTSKAIVSNETLLADGGTLFLFRKQDNNITGVFSYVDGEAICVRGQVNGNTVSGAAVQTIAGVSVLSAGESFASFGPSGMLAVRRGRQVSNQKVRYGSALLNLAGLNRINAGTVIPPKVC